MITPAQLRAARGLLDWTRVDLAKAAGISPETIKNIEHGVFRPQEGTAEAIVKAFASHSVEFIEGEGVRKSNHLVTHYEGKEAFREYVDNFYKVISEYKQEKLVYVVGMDDNLFIQALGDYVKIHAERMAKLSGLRFMALTDIGHASPIPPYVQCRAIPKAPLQVPFNIYANCFDFIIYGHGEDYPKVVSVQSEVVVAAYRLQFESLWDNAQPLQAL